MPQASSDSGSVDPESIPGTRRARQDGTLVYHNPALVFKCFICVKNKLYFHVLCRSSLSLTKARTRGIIHCHLYIQLKQIPDCCFQTDQRSVLSFNAMNSLVRFRVQEGDRDPKTNLHRYGENLWYRAQSGTWDWTPNVELRHRFYTDGPQWFNNCSPATTLSWPMVDPELLPRTQGVNLGQFTYQDVFGRWMERKPGGNLHRNIENRAQTVTPAQNWTYYHLNPF